MGERWGLGNIGHKPSPHFCPDSEKTTSHRPWLTAAVVWARGCVMDARGPYPKHGGRASGGHLGRLLLRLMAILGGLSFVILVAERGSGISPNFN